MSNVFDKKSAYDPDQITRMGFDDKLRAHRMVVIGADFQTGTIPVQTDPTNTKIERVEIPFPVKEIEIREVHIPTIVKEIEVVKIEVPVVHKEIEIVRVEVPVVVKQIEVQTLEKPVFVTQTEYKDLPIWAKVCLAVQTLTLLIILLKK